MARIDGIKAEVILVKKHTPKVLWVTAGCHHTQAHRVHDSMLYLDMILNQSRNFTHAWNDIIGTEKIVIRIPMA